MMGGGDREGEVEEGERGGIRDGRNEKKHIVVNGNVAVLWWCLCYRVTNIPILLETLGDILHML